MRRTFRLLASLTFAAVMGGTALAADLDNIINAPQEDPYVPVEIGTGWYIRGDISYDLATSTDASYRTYDGASYSTSSYDNFDYRAGSDWSVGAGYQFNSFLRGDVTVGSWHRQVAGTDTDPNPCTLGGVFGSTCRSEDTTKANAWESMVNGYADLGTFVGVTPYIGGGVGLTHLTYSDLVNTAYCVDGVTGLDTGVCDIGTHPGESSWRFTWALMAGASYDISKNLKFDLGYRYSRISGGAMFGFDATSVTNGATGTQGSDNGFSTHQIKAGVRYAIW
jgi:opacity protein-like surface antigen